MKGLTKFLKNKNTVTILGVLACLVILYAGYTMRINQKTALVTVYYANQTIQPKTVITEAMVSRMDVPASFIRGTYYKDYNDIIGKYSNYNTMIAEGSIFYLPLLVDGADLPDAILYDVNEGERIVSFPVDTMTTYGNSIMPGNLIDIYVKLLDNSEKLVYGEMYEKIEVLGVKDASGRNVFESTEESRTPAYIYFSLPEAKYLLFSALNYLEDEENEIEVVIVPNTVKYTPEEEETIVTEVTSEYLSNYVLNKLSQIDDQKELYYRLLNDVSTFNFNKKNKVNTPSENQENQNNQNNQ